MLAYAPRPAARSGSPRTLLLVAAGHAVALGLLLTARSDLVSRTPFDPTDVVFVPTKVPPPPLPPPPSEPAPPRATPQSTLDTPPVIIPTPRPDAVPVTEGPPILSVTPLAGTAPDPQPPLVADPPTPALVRRAARFATPADLVRPPFPAARRESGDGAILRLTLAIDPRGRVSAVTPVGAADAVFLDAARRHILRHWRYRPALEGDAAIASNVTITLRFEIED
jgi:protein TonB